ncbi:MAG: hypothetical protein GY789_23680 [Hyphomicrobiales bacterium]|nr:hypothetical protein [Hyphomicrobiales bacterium]
MTPDPDFQDWTAKAIEHRIIEAAETLALYPKAFGPKAYGNSMPEPLRLQRDAYASNAPRYRRKPSAGAMDRMEECWTWINALNEKQDRQLLYDWARAKGGWGRSLKLLAVEEGMSDRTLRREITRMCKAIAQRLNGIHSPKPSQSIGDRSPHAHEDDNAKKPNRSYKLHRRTQNARPDVDVSQPALRTISRQVADCTADRATMTEYG